MKLRHLLSVPLFSNVYLTIYHFKDTSKTLMPFIRLPLTDLIVCLFVRFVSLLVGSGPCDTFDSPCLASGDQFTCADVELFVFESPLLS